jgi:ribonuclease D
LSPDQLRYAREDVLLLPDLVRALEDRLASQDNAGIAEACTAEIYERTLETPNPDQAWRSVAGVHLLDGTERAVLRALVTWRDARARDLDMPRPNVASDAALFELARRQPATTDELKANRRTPSTLWKRDGEAVLACITEGRAAEPPAPALPRTRVWLDCVRTAARVAEGHRGVASELSLDARTLERIATGASVEGWREEALGPGFTAFLEGRASIVMPGIFVRF